MKPNESFVDQPIRSLQTMLRTIAAVEPGQVNVIPDGVYGPQTAEAVRSFQRRMGLPITGVVDQTTHEQIVQAFERAKTETEKAQAVQINLDPGQVIRRGEKNQILYLVQSMLTVMSLLYPQIQAPGFSGVLDPATAAALAEFQTWAGLPPTGELDKQTWKQLAIHYALAADWLENLDEI